MTLGKIIDWIGRNLGRIKTVGIMVLITLFLMSVGRHGCDVADMEDLVEKITGLNVQNDILNNDIKGRDSLLNAKDNRIIVLQDSLTESENRFMSLENVYEDLEEEYQGLADSIQQVPVDTSYSFLTEEAYPLEGPGSYPFNEPQVRGIHLTFLERLTLKDINGIMRDQIKELSYQANIQDSVVVEYNASLELLKADTTDMSKIIDNQDLMIDAQGHYIRDQKRKKSLWQILGAAIIVILAAIAAAG
jgi:hypothetical protein